VVCHLPHRNSAPAIAHLLQTVNAAHILISSEARIKAVVQEALDTMKDATKTLSNFVSEMPAYSDIFQDGDAELLPVKKFDPNSPAFFIHSSGKFCSLSCLESYPYGRSRIYRLSQASCLDARYMDDSCQCFPYVSLIFSELDMNQSGCSSSVLQQ
jgi:hypothetical protein